MTTNKMHTSGAVATEVHLPRWKLVYLIERGVLPQPTFNVPGRRLFTEADITAIRKALDAKPQLRAAVWHRNK